MRRHARPVTQSCPTLCNPVDCSPSGSSVHGIPQARNTGAGCHFLLQGIFPTQGLNLRLLMSPALQVDNALPPHHLGIPHTLREMWQNQVQGHQAVGWGWGWGSGRLTASKKRSPDSPGGNKISRALCALWGERGHSVQLSWFSGAEHPSRRSSVSDPQFLRPRLGLSDHRVRVSTT